MIKWRYFPSNSKPSEAINEIVKIFIEQENDISSHFNELDSNSVLKIITPKLQSLGFEVEMSKKKVDKVRVPVLFGENGKESLAFEADGYWEKEKLVIEVEAGRAVTNYQFLKDFFQACMMNNVDYLCIAMRQVYRKNDDYIKVCEFFSALHASNRMQTPLKGILIIGY